MTKLEDIEKAIVELNDEERAKLRAFLDELEADLWDAQIERDAKAGKLDKLEARALENLKEGRVKDL
jgi:hypothetical protein